MGDTMRVSQWFVLRRGESDGPFDEATIVAWINDGMVDAQIRPDTAPPSFPWLSLDTHEPFAEALRARTPRAGAEPDRRPPLNRMVEQIPPRSTSTTVSARGF